MTFKAKRLPPRVVSVNYFDSPPPEPSRRLGYWLWRLEHGWRPPARLGEQGYLDQAEWYGVYLWEFSQVLRPRLRELAHAARLENLKLAQSTRAANLRKGGAA